MNLVRFAHNWNTGMMARPPRPETGTGSGGASCLEYNAVVEILWEPKS